MADSQRKTAQLFDKDNVNSVNAYFNSSNPSLITSDNAKCIYIQCEPNTTYTVNKAVSSRFFVGSCETEPQVGTVVNNTVGGNDWQGYLTITTGNSDLYLVAFVYRAQDTMTFAELCDTIMINKGSVALPWQPYSSTGWVHSLRKLTTATDTFTTLPVNIYADGNNAAVGLKGNTVQNGTPTPSNPVDVNGVGERTENLLDYSTFVNDYWLNNNTGLPRPYNNGGRIATTSPIDVNNVNNVTFNYTSEVANTQFMYSLFNGSTLIERVTGQSSGTTIDVSNGDTLYLCLYRTTTLPITISDVSNAMLNVGSTAKPYEPYGYKIPISSASTTTPVYLGEVETTRKIGKIDLSEVSWTMLASGLWRTLDIPNIKYVSVNTELGGGIAEKYTIHTGAGMISALNCIAIDVSQVSVNTGSNTETPTGMFWYVLATEETGIVNEPLMKIGDYSDTVSGVTVPMIIGKNTFDVETTLKPSEASLSYTGWHDAEVKEKSRNLFDYNTVTFGKYIDSNGNEQTSSGTGEQSLNRSGFIAVTAETVYTFKCKKSPIESATFNAFCWFDSNKQFIKRATFDAGAVDPYILGTATAPINAAYLIMNYRGLHGDTAMLNEGSTALPYESYWK